MRASRGASAARAAADALERASERSDLGAFWALDDSAVERGGRADAGGGHGMPLLGATVAVKDLFDQAGLPTTAGLRGEAGPAERDAALVRRLRASGAVPVGKAAMDPLGLTTGGQAPGFPPCVNPVDPSLSPGGSSSGSAVAVAAGITGFGLGTDTAGSIRIPAAYCGVAGLKPALGRLRREGMTQVMGQWDIPGVLAADLAGCLALLEVLTGAPAPRPARRTLRVGLLDDMLAAAEPAVAERCRDVADGLPGAKVEPVDLGWDGRGYGLVLAHEFAAVWGGRVDADPRGFPKLARSLCERSREAGPKSFTEVAALMRREREAVARRLGSFDAFIAPTTPTPAPPREEEDVAVSSRFTRVFSALGWPAASVPAGEIGGAPVGVQVAGRPSRFGEMVAVARAAEQVGKPAGRRA